MFIKTLSLRVIVALLMCQACSSTPINEAQQTPNNTKTTETYPAYNPDFSSYPAPNFSTSITPEPPSSFNTLSSGKASVSGVLYSYTARMIIPATQLYLTPAVGDDQKQVPLVFIGPQISAGDIQTVTNEKGQFLISNVPPDNYYLAVWSPVGWSIAYQAEGSTEPLLIELIADQATALNIVYLAWP